jgi:hypothetical protein
LRTPASEAANLLEQKVLPAYRHCAQRIHTRNARRRERREEEQAITADMARWFGGPARIDSGYHNKTRCTLPDGRSEIDLYTASPRVEMRFVIDRDHAVAIAPELARLLNVVPS